METQDRRTEEESAGVKCGSYHCRGGHKRLFKGTEYARLNSIDCGSLNHFNAERSEKNNQDPDPWGLHKLREKYKAGSYKFKAAPVCTAAWGDDDFIRFIASQGGFQD